MTEFQSHVRMDRPDIALVVAVVLVLTIAAL
jgi:hypothetical protein